MTRVPTIIWVMAISLVMAMLALGENRWVRFLNSEGGGPGTETLAEKRAELTTKQERMAKVFDEAGEMIDLMKCTTLKEGTTSRERAAEVKGMNDELTDLGKQVDELQGVHDAKKEMDELKARQLEQKHPGDKGEKSKAGILSPFSQYVKTDAFKSRPKGKGDAQAMHFEDLSISDLVLDPIVKAFMEKADFGESLAQGWPSQAIRSGLLVLDAQRPVAVMDIIPTINISQNAYVYMEETTFTNAAAETAENTAFPEATLDLTEQSSAVRKIPVILPVTDEQLEDVPAAEQYVNDRLAFMVRQRLDSQIIVGNGTPPNLRGILNVVGIGSQAKAADDTPTAIYKAITLVRVNAFTEPNAAIIHPTDWQDIATLKTADGIFIWGNPSNAGPERIWGLPVLITTAITVNTGLVGDFRNFSLLAQRRGVDIQVGFDGNDFSTGRRSVRADMRTAFVVTRPAAFAEITGI